MNRKDTAITVTLCAVFTALIVFSKEAKAGAQNGMALCEAVIIPALLPVLMISKTMVTTRCADVFEAVFHRLFRALFHLPEGTAAAVIFGLIGGYPTGAVLTQTLFSENRIDRKTAQKMMTFNFCGGAAFIITAVGTVTYRSTKVGVLLFSVNVISSLITAAAVGLFQKQEDGQTEIRAEKRLPFGEALSDAAESSVRALAVMSVFIVFFSALCGVIHVPQAVVPLTEITAGICRAKAPLPLPAAAFYLSFGGLCVHFQIAGIIKKMHLRYVDFLLGRLFGASLSFLLTKAYLLLFPQSITVFYNGSDYAFHFSRGNLAFSLVMMVGCAVIIFDIENQKIKLHSTK